MMPPIDSMVIIKPEVDATMKYAGVVFKVVGHLRTNIRLEAVGAGAALLGRQARLRINPDLVIAAPADADASSTATSVVVPYLPPLVLGTVFTVPAGTLRGVDESTLLVVLGTKGPAYQAARLGGDEDRYFRSVARAAMREVPLAELRKRLSA